MGEPLAHAAMDPREISIADHSYVLPEDRIAQRPLPERDRSKLLVFRNGSIQDRVFHELPTLLEPGSLLVLNDTRVVNAKLIFQRDSGARVEVLCLEPSDGGPVEAAFACNSPSSWNCFIGNAKRWKEGPIVIEQGELRLSASRTGPERVDLQWEPATLSLAEVLERVGHVPLPPYMKRPDEGFDKERYNTVFADHDGSVAAPTASLHFTDATLRELASMGIATTRLTLHVGAGTFLPVKSVRMAEHAMHMEQIRVTRTALEHIISTHCNAPVIPVGTTALRTLESVYWHGVMLIQGRAGREVDVDQWEPYEHAQGSLPSPLEALQAVMEQMDASGEDRLTGRTRLLIAPGYRFRLTDALVTNFHQPRSTLLLLVAALAGPEWRRIYDHALANNYRMLSYGDASLLYRVPS